MSVSELDKKNEFCRPVDLRLKKRNDFGWDRNLNPIFSFLSQRKGFIFKNWLKWAVVFLFYF